MDDENENQSDVNSQQTPGNVEQTLNTGVPTLVKAISVLFYIGSVLGIILGIAMIFGASFIGVIVKDVPLFEIIGGLGVGLFIALGIVFIGTAILEFFVAKGLWNGKSWARVVAIIFSVLGTLFALLSLIQGSIASILSLLINGTIGGYLIFSKSVKSAFS